MIFKKSEHCLYEDLMPSNVLIGICQVGKMWAKFIYEKYYMIY